MSQTSRYHVMPDGSVKAFIPRDQPCNVTWCQSNQGGGCIKRFNGGRMPNNYGTPRCPGLQCTPPAPRQERATRRTIVWKGIQTKIFQGGDEE